MVVKSEFLKKMMAQAQPLYKTIVLPEGEDIRVLEAAHIVNAQKMAKIIILGDDVQIKNDFAKNNWDLNGIEVINPLTSSKLQQYADLLFALRREKGMTPEEALKTAQDNTYFGVLMIKAGDADGMVSGANHSTADTVRPALQIIKSARKNRSVSSFFVMVSGEKEYIFADCGLIIEPTDKELADIALESAMSAIRFGVEPNVAMLSFSTYGSGKSESVDKVKSATKIAQEMLKEEEYQGLNIQLDGELQADAALDVIVAQKKCAGSPVAGKAKVLVFPNIDAGNISYKLVQRLGGFEAYGPILQGLNSPINDLSRGASVEDIIGTIAITVLQGK